MKTLLNKLGGALVLLCIALMIIAAMIVCAPFALVAVLFERTFRGIQLSPM